MAQSGFHSKRGMKGLVTILLWVCGAFMQMAYASEQKTFSFEEDARNRPIMAVEVNGVSTTALLDTGATIALLDHAYFEEDCLQGWSEQATKILGIGGQKLYPVTELTDLSVGSRSWSDVRVAVNTGNRFPVDHGILPITLFKRLLSTLNLISPKSIFTTDALSACAAGTPTQSSTLMISA